MSHLSKPALALVALALTLSTVTVGASLTEPTVEPAPQASTASTPDLSRRTTLVSRSHRRALLNKQPDVVDDPRGAVFREEQRQAREKARRAKARQEAREAERLRAEQAAAEAAARVAEQKAAAVALEAERKAAASYDLAGNRGLGRQIMLEFGFGADQWPALERLWSKESGWNHLAANPSSSAYGIPQALPGSKMASAGADWATNPATQIRWGLGYIRDRYGSPTAAMAHSDSVGWY